MTDVKAELDALCIAWRHDFSTIGDLAQRAASIGARGERDSAINLADECAKALFQQGEFGMARGAADVRDKLRARSQDPESQIDALREHKQREFDESGLGLVSDLMRGPPNPLDKPLTVGVAQKVLRDISKYITFNAAAYRLQERDAGLYLKNKIVEALDKSADALEGST